MKSYKPAQPKTQLRKQKKELKSFNMEWLKYSMYCIMVCLMKLGLGWLLFYRIPTRLLLSAIFKRSLTSSKEQTFQEGIQMCQEGIQTCQEGIQTCQEGNQTTTTTVRWIQITTNVPTGHPNVPKGQ